MEWFNKLTSTGGSNFGEAGRGAAAGRTNKSGPKKRAATNDGGAPARKAPKCGLCGVEGIWSYCLVVKLDDIS